MRDIISLSTRPVAVEGERQTVALDAIELGVRLRPINPDYVQALAVSMAGRGLITPIRVRQHPASGNGVMLVAGAHRVAAARLLEWTEIEVSFREMSEDEARIEEIDENVFRQELSTLDMAVSMLERKLIHERLFPETAHGKAKKPKTEKGKVANIATFQTFAKDAARKTGLSERSIRDYVALAATLTPEIIAYLRASGIADNGQQLKRLAEIEEPENRLKVAAALASGAPSVERALNETGLGQVRIDDPDEKAFAAFLGIWGRASAKARAAIKTHVNQYDSPGPAARKARAAQGATS